MSSPGHPDALLVPYILRTLTQERHRAVKKHLSTCARCTKMLRQVELDVADFAMALEPSMPPAVGRESLLQAINEIPRLADCHAPLASLFRVTETLSAEILRAVDEPGCWEKASTGRRRLTADLPKGANIWRLSPAEELHFEHEVAGAQARILVIQGFCHDSDGLLIGPTETRCLGGEGRLIACGPIDTVCASFLERVRSAA